MPHQSPPSQPDTRGPSLTVGVITGTVNGEAVGTLPAGQGAMDEQASAELGKLALKSMNLITWIDPP